MAFIISPVCSLVHLLGYVIFSYPFLFPLSSPVFPCLLSSLCLLMMPCLVTSCFILLVSCLLCTLFGFAFFVLCSQQVSAVFPGVSCLSNYLVCIYCLSLPLLFVVSFPHGSLFTSSKGPHLFFLMCCSAFLLFFFLKFQQ